jgi:Permease family
VTGCNSFFGAIAMTLPSTTFAQNNGVIALTRCASRWAGVACGIWLIIFGVLAKVGGWVTTIPGDAVIPAAACLVLQNACGAQWLHYCCSNVCSKESQHCGQFAQLAAALAADHCDVLPRY